MLGVKGFVHKLLPLLQLTFRASGNQCKQKERAKLLLVTSSFRWPLVVMRWSWDRPIMSGLC